MTRIWFCGPKDRMLWRFRTFLATGQGVSSTEVIVWSQRSGTAFMNEKTDPFIRDVARIVGREVAKTSEFALDRAQDVMLLLLQNAAAASATNRSRKNALAKASAAVNTFSQSSFIIPLVAGRIASFSTYVGLRVGVEVVGRVQRILADLTRS